jgi:hypothetical protein
MALTATDLYWVDGSAAPNDQNEVLLTLPSGDPTGAPNQLVTSGMNCVEALAVASGNADWLQTGCFAHDGALESVVLSPLSQSAANLLPSLSLSGPYSVRIAADTTGVYFSENPTGVLGAGTIGKAPRAGGDIATIVPVANANAVGVDGTHVYWTDFHLGAVMTAPLAGGAAVTLASGQTNPYDLVLDDTAVYWTNNSNPGGVFKVAKP